MIYKLTENPVLPAITGFVYNFSVGPYVYIEDNPKPVSGSYEYYVPTTEEVEAMATEFNDWASTVGVTRTGDINSYLSATDIQAYKDVLWKDYEDLMETFDLTGLNKVMHFTSSLGFRCNGDRRSLENIKGLVAILQDDETTVQFRDYDNQMHELNRAQLSTLQLELQMNGLNLYNQKWDREAKTKAAETLEQLRDISYTVEWKDFSTGGIEQPESGDSVTINDAATYAKSSFDAIFG